MGDPHDRRSWRRLSVLKRRTAVLCERCLAAKPQRLTPATQVHHKHSLRDGGQLLVSLDDGLEALCASCHSRVTNATDLNNRVRPRIGPDGWPIVE